MNFIIKRTNNDIVHYGKKGMQWGVLHGPPYPINKETSVTRIRKGGQIRRLSIRDENAATGHAYVTFLKNDNERYKGFFGARLKGLSRGGKVYSVEMTAKNDLLSPSRKTRVDTFVEMYKDDPVLRKELGNYYKTRKKLSPMSEKFYQKKFSDLDGDELRTKGYDTFAQSLGGNQYIRDKYFKKLSAKGYQFVIDDLDAGKFGEAPAILFDRKRSVKYDGQTEVTGKEIMDTWRREGTRVKKYK